MSSSVEIQTQASDVKIEVNTPAVVVPEVAAPPPTAAVSASERMSAGLTAGPVAAPAAAAPAVVSLKVDSRLIARVIEARAGKAVNSLLEAVSVVCAVVELHSREQQNSTGVALNALSKSQLAFEIAGAVFQALYEFQPQPLLTTAMYQLAGAAANDVAVFAPLVDAVIAVASDSLLVQNLKIGCCRRFFCCCC